MTYITFGGTAVLSCFCHRFSSAATNVKLLDLDWELMKIKKKIVKYFPFGGCWLLDGSHYTQAQAE